MIKAGTARMDITPPTGYRLQGFAKRKGISTAVHDPLFVKILTLSDGRNRVAIMTADLIDYPPELSQRIKSFVCNKTGIRPDHFMLTASHTHSGPLLIANSTQIPRENYLPEYVNHLIQCIAGCVREAMLHEEEVSLHWGVGELNIGTVNRRKKVNGIVVMEPDPEGPVDDEITTLLCRRKDGTNKAILFNYCCHPIIMGGLGSEDLVEITAEYPGVAQRELERMYPGAQAMFTNGCAGDITHDITRHGKFFGGTYADMERMGKLLSAQVVINCEQSVPLKIRKLGSRLSSIALPFEEKHIPRAMDQLESLTEIYCRMMPEFKDTYIQKWREIMKDSLDRGIHQPGSLPSTMQVFQLGDFSLLGLEGEVMVELGLEIKQKVKKPLMVAGYANAMVGYIPTAQSIRDGGYEGMSFIFEYYPAPFAKSLQKQFVNHALELVTGKRKAS